MVSIGRRDQYPGAEEFVPRGRVSLPVLREAAQGCRGCDLYKHATQAVMGNGAVPARYMIIGEAPGDQEDLQGLPFVGPAGKLLRRAMNDAGIDVGKTYLTNAVKHFKWTQSPRGKRRLHARPSAGQVRACLPWLHQEIGMVKPRVLVLLGATAAQALLGPGFRVSKERGKVIERTEWGVGAVATVHPSALLRAPEGTDRDAEYAGFVADLKAAARAGGPSGRSVAAWSGRAPRRGRAGL